MSSTGAVYPQSVTTAAVAPESANDWLTQSNVLSGSDSEAEAQITAATYDSPDISYRLIVSNFGFNIASGDTINGITVEINRRCFAGSAADYRVQLQDASGTLVGANKATGTAWPGTLGVATYGGAADTWTASPTPAMVNDPDFGVVLSVSATSANTDIGVDYIRVTITYTHNATQYPHTETASVGFTGAIAKQASRALSAAVSFSGALVTATARLRSLTGDLTFGGAVERKTLREHTGTLTFSVTFDQQFQGGVEATPALIIIHYHVE